MSGALSTAGNPPSADENGKATPIYVVGYPGYVGGADTELWHTLRLWRNAGFDVRIIPTWQAHPDWKTRLEGIGVPTYQIAGPANLASVSDLPGSTVVSFCNGDFLVCAFVQATRLSTCLGELHDLDLSANACSGRGRDLRCPMMIGRRMGFSSALGCGRYGPLCRRLRSRVHRRREMRGA